MKSLFEIANEYKLYHDNSVLTKALSGPYPAKAKERIKNPIIVSQKWQVSPDKSLMFKEFFFKDLDKRNSFIFDLLTHEKNIGHFAEFSINGHNLSITLRTHDVGSITELDKEYSKYIDLVYKDIIFGSER